MGGAAQAGDGEGLLLAPVRAAVHGNLQLGQGWSPCPPSLPLPPSLPPSFPLACLLARPLSLSLSLSLSLMRARSTPDPDLPSLVSLFCAGALPPSVSPSVCLPLSLCLPLVLPDGSPVREPGPLLRSGEMERAERRGRRGLRRKEQGGEEREERRGRRERRGKQIEERI